MVIIGIGVINMKIQMSLNDDLVQKVDKYSKENYLSRSAVVSIALNQYLLSHEVSTAIKEMSLAMRKIADTGELDSESLQKMEDFERFARLFTTVK